jgi:branched-chain amino acid transport system permease protein
MLFLMSAGLTLVFGIMNLINLAHGSLYMAGAFIAASLISATGSFFLSVFIAVAATSALGMVMEIVILRPFYARTHLDQVLVTFGLILVLNEITRLIWGPVPVPMPLPAYLAGSVELFAGVRYPVFRLAILLVGAVVAVGLYLVVVHTRAGMWVRAGAANRPMASALGVDVQFVFLMVFAVGAALAGLAGIMAGPIFAVQVGMGEQILILAFVVTVIGGIGSIRGAFLAALLIGIVDTFGRVLLPPALGSMVIFILMAAILAWRPRGLFPLQS